MLKLIKKIFPYLFLTIVSIITFFYIYRSWGLNLDIPYFYRGDGLWSMASIKGFMENGSFLINKNIGAIFGSNFYDYPGSEGLYNASIIFLSFFIKDPVSILNFYYLLTYIITSAVSFFTLKYFKISNNLAILASLIISFLSYHVGKGTGHINLGTYYMIPLVFIVLYWIYSNQLEAKIKIVNIFKSKLLYSVVILFLLSNNGIYYSLFTISFLILTGVISSYEHKNIKHFLISLFLSSIIIIGILLNVAPNLIHKYKYGGNPKVAARSYNEAEYYGLKIIDLFMPVTSFNNDYVRKYKERYDNLSFTHGESYSYLGIIGSIGFLILFLNLFNKKSSDKKINLLSFLNLWALSLAITSGIGTMIGYLITSQIRVYSRISIFIAIFSIFALCFTIDKYLRRFKKFNLLVNGIFILIFIFAILDQAKIKSSDFVGTAKLYLSDKSFVQEIEKEIKDEGIIFQLPYKAFPETGPINSLTDYDLFRPYIHSQKTKWSYGIIKETPEDQWIKDVSSLPIEEMVKKLTVSGYNGIYIDTVGYSDKGKEIIKQLSFIIEEKPIISKQGDLIYFSLAKYYEKQLNTLGKNKFEEMRKDTRKLPIIIWWDKNFYPEETDGQDKWRWSKKRSSFTIINGNNDKKKIIMEFSAVSNYPEYSNLTISSKLFTKNLRINGVKTIFKKQIELPQGKFEVKFDTDSKKVVLPNVTTELYFRIFNLKIKKLE